MQQSKPIKSKLTITGQLVPGRDDRALEFFSQPHVNKSEVIRLGIDLYLDHLEHLDNLANISADILEALTRIEKTLQGSISVAPETPETKSENPFFNASP